LILMNNAKISKAMRGALGRLVISERQGLGACLVGGAFAVSCRALERHGLARLDLSLTVEAYLPTEPGRRFVEDIEAGAPTAKYA
jgi:hypothetical protein